MQNNFTKNNLFTDDLFDKEQAEKDFGLSLDVAYDDIISVQGSHPPLIEKPAQIVYDDKG